jgi:hypothetical protein
MNVFPFKRRFNYSSENKSRIYSLPICELCHAFFTDIKYCKQSKSLCFLNIFFKHIIVKRQEKIQKYKNGITLFIVLLVEKLWLNQNRFIFICFWSDLNMNLSLSGATVFVKAEPPGIKVFIPKLFCYHIHEKSMYIFTETIHLFVCFLPVFSSFRIRVLYLSNFQFLSASLWKYTTALISN